MKLTTFLLLISLLQVSASTFGQKVTLKGNEMTVSSIFKEIRKQTGYSVMLDKSNFNTDRKFTANFTNASIQTVMDQVLAGTDFTYVIEEKNIVVEQKEKSLLDRVVERFQNIDVTGKVIDPDGRPVPGASISVKGTKISTISQGDGTFVLKNVDENASIVISYQGFETIETKAGKSLGTIRFKESTNPLDEVQVIAYGTTTRRLSTGNTGTVKADQIERQPVTNPLLALQGRVAGLVVTQNSGVPGGGVTVRIQGRNSISSGNDPLYIIDGVPIQSQLPQIFSESNILGNSGAVARNSRPSAGSPLSFLNPSDIESIDVLKDADATAIYGSRAANGAILITTKSGKSGKMRVSFNTQSGRSWQPSRLEVMNTRQYLDMRYEAYRNDGIDWKTLSNPPVDLAVWDTTRYTNWQNELLGGVSSFSNTNLSFTGGNNGTNYLISGTYSSEGMPFPGDFGSKNTSVKFNLNNVSLNQKLSLKFTGSFSSNNSDLPFGDPTYGAMFFEPNAPNPFNPDGTLNWAPNASGSSTFTSNPYINLLRTSQLKTQNLFGNFSAGFKILKNLELSANLGYSMNYTDQLNKTPTSSITPELRVTTFNNALYGDRNLQSLIFEPQVNYRFNILKGKFDALAGFSIQESKTKVMYVTGQNYPSDEVLDNLELAGSVISYGSSVTQYKYGAIFGRLNYNLLDKYVVNFSARRDGTSRFGSNNQFHTFGSVGAAWIFSKSNWVQDKISFLSHGKIRGSYGLTGNDQIADYQFMSLYNRVPSEIPYQNVIGFTPAGLPNRSLQWETTKKTSVGIDLGFLKDRIVLNSSYSSNTSKDLLETLTTPSFVGFVNYIANFPGVVRNTTWEFMLNSSVIKTKSFEWQFNTNFSIPRNILVSFPNIETSAYSSTLKVGKSLDMQNLVVFAGVDPASGNYQFMNINGELTPRPIFPNDYIQMNLSPKWYGGINNSFQVGNINIDFFIQLVKQNGRYAFLGNGGAISTPGVYSQGNSNQPTNILENRWRNPGDEALVKKFSSLTTSTIVYSSTAGFGDASFARLKNVSISWNLPDRWLSQIRVKQGRMFTQAQNLLTISNYKGLNPETPIQSPKLPPLRVITLGVQIVL